jgi:alcohol dehydrogenase (NADP+)
VNKEYLKENFDLHELDKEDFDVISDLRKESGLVRFLDPSNHLGFDIFDENEDQPVDNSAPWDT